MTALSNQTLAEIGARVPVPLYDRATVRPGIAHIGVGGFHRAHQASYLDHLLTMGDHDGWGLVGIELFNQRIVQVLNAQDGLYTLVEKPSAGQWQARVIGSVTGALFVPDNPDAAVERLADEAIRIVSLTITESGYLLDDVTGEFLAQDPAVQADLDAGGTRTAFGLITRALRLRRERGIAPFTVLSCDNVLHNGRAARTALVGYANLVDPELASWIADNVAFPSCMVDGITPVTLDSDREQVATRFGIDDGWPVVCEPYRQWVLQDNFPTGRPAWERVGAQLADDVEPYEHMKLRLLNAAHMVLAYVGILSGLTYAHEVIQDEIFGPFVSGYLLEEGMPAVPPVPGVDLPAYCAVLMDRFGNPNVADTLYRLTIGTSGRLPKFLLPVIQHNLAHGGQTHRSAMVCGAIARWVELRATETGQPLEIDDRVTDQLLAASAGQDADPLAFLRQPAIFGDLADNPRFAEQYLSAYRALREVGARQAVADLSRS